MTRSGKVKRLCSTGKPLASFAVLVLILGTHLNAQPVVGGYPTKYAQAGMAFLRIDVGSRLASMGGAGTSVEESVNDMFANPAGLAFVDVSDVATTVTNWIADIKHYGGGAAISLGNLGTFGLSFVAMDYGDFRRTVPYSGADPALSEAGYLDLGTFNVNEFAVGLAYGRRITQDFYIGAHVRYVEQDLGTLAIFDQVSGSSAASEWKLNNISLDFGTMYFTGWKDLRFGMSLRNFANQANYYNQRFELPLTFSFGLAMDVLLLFREAGKQEFNIAVDWKHPRDVAERLHMGAEYGLMDLFFLRGGYKMDLSPSVAGEEGPSFGMGVRLDVRGRGLRADYAYTSFGKFFGQVHRVTFGAFGLN